MGKVEGRAGTVPHALVINVICDNSLFRSFFHMVL